MGRWQFWSWCFQYIKSIDKLVWYYTGAGNYTMTPNMMWCYTAIVEELIASLEVEQMEIQVVRMKWSSTGTGSNYWKVKHLLWNCCLGIVPSKESMWKWKLPADIHCPLCDECPQSIYHLVVNCSSVKNLMSGWLLFYVINKYSAVGNGEVSRLWSLVWRAFLTW